MTLPFMYVLYLMQVSQVKSACSEAIQELKHWMKPEKVIACSSVKMALIFISLG